MLPPIAKATMARTRLTARVQQVVGGCELDRRSQDLAGCGQNLGREPPALRDSFADHNEQDGDQPGQRTQAGHA